MRTVLALVSIVTLSTFGAACRAPGDFPSLAPRSAEGVDPRLPIASEPSPGSVDAAVADRLASAVAQARGGTANFNALAGTAERLAAAAGARQSEGWIAAQQALSALTAQHGVTTTAAAKIDALAADRIDAARWINPATQAAVGAAAAAIGAINDAQTATIKRLSARLGV